MFYADMEICCCIPDPRFSQGDWRVIMSEEVYSRLREFLDQLPGGYPETPTGVEIRILKKLFSPEDAELTMKLKPEPEGISSIANRLGVDESEAAEKLVIP